MGKNLMFFGDFNTDLLNGYKDPDFVSWFEQNLYSASPFEDLLFYPKPSIGHHHHRPHYYQIAGSKNVASPIKKGKKTVSKSTSSKPFSKIWKPKVIHFNPNDASHKKPSAYAKKPFTYKRPIFTKAFFPKPLQSMSSVNTINKNGQKSGNQPAPDDHDEPYSGEITGSSTSGNSVEAYDESHEDYGSAEHDNSLQDLSSVEIEESDSQKIMTARYPPRR